MHPHVLTLPPAYNAYLWLPLGTSFPLPFTQRRLLGASASLLVKLGKGHMCLSERAQWHAAWRKGLMASSTNPRHQHCLL